MKSTSGSSKSSTSAGKTTITAKDASGKDIDITKFTDAFDKTKASSDAAGEFAGHKLLLSTSSLAAGSADIKLIDAAKDREVEDFIANHSGTLFVSSANNINNVSEKVELGTSASNSHTKYLTVAVATTATTASTTTNTTPTLLDSQTLQETELFVEKTPTKFDGGPAATLIQGPSLIAIHNSTEDAVAKEFAK